MSSKRFTVVIAIEHSGENLPDILQALAPATNPDVEVIVCHAGTAPPSGVGATVKWLQSAPGARIPHMWRDGLLGAQGEWVALLTAHCIPDADWLPQLRALAPDDDVAAVGGFFRQADGSCGRDWAIYLLRYVSYSRPREVHATDHVAADNAVYRRSAVLACADLLPEGFWEPAFHVRFRAGGQRLELTSRLQVIHRNRYSGREFAAQRREHGLQFGSERARRAPAARRILLALTAPLIPAVLLAKVLIRTARNGWLLRLPLTTVPWLAFFVGNWASGEARGLWRRAGANE